MIALRIESSLLVAVFAAWIALSGGCDDKKESLLSGNHMKRLSLAILMYQQANNNRYPDRLDQIKPHLPEYDTVIKNPLTGDNPGYEYVKPTDKAPPEPMLYQLRDGKRDTSLDVCWVDGSVRPMR